MSIEVGGFFMTIKGCVLIHGFTGSPAEIEILAKHLKNKGMLVSTPVLAGHDYTLNRKEMRSVTWQDWLDSAEKVIIEMQSQVDELYLIGFSMGGIIASYLSTKYRVKKLVLLSASVLYLKPKSFVRDLIQKPLTKSQFNRYLHKIKETPFKATLNFRKLVKELVPYLKHVNTPTLIIQGEMDDLVDPKSAQYIYDTIRSNEKYLYFLPKSKHVICLDCEKEKVVELTDKFFR